MNTPDCRTVLQSAGLGMRGLRMSIQQHSSRHSWLSKELKHCIVDADWLLPSLIATNSLVRLSPLPFPSWARMKIRDNEVGKVDEGHNMFFCHSSCTFVLFHAPSPYNTLCCSTRTIHSAAPNKKRMESFCEPRPVISAPKWKRGDYSVRPAHKRRVARQPCACSKKRDSRESTWRNRGLCWGRPAWTGKADFLLHR